MFSYVFDFILIFLSRIFDANYYLNNYPDVKNKGVNPLWHFVKHGWKEGRNPTGKFDTSYYLLHNPDVRFNGINPLVHYIRWGKKEGRLTLPVQENVQNGDDFSRIYDSAFGDIQSELTKRGKQYRKKTSLPFTSNLNSKMNRSILLLWKGIKVIKESGIQELVERIQEFNKRNAAINATQGAVSTKTQQAHPRLICFHKRLTTKRLLSLLQKSILHNEYVLAISHDNYLKIVGGVQLKIMDEQKQAQKSGKSFLHVYPFIFSPYFVDDSEEFLVSVNVDEKTLGTIRGKDFIEAISHLQNKQLISIDIHHTMGFNMAFVHKLLLTTKGVPVHFWLHDMFSICPNYLLMRNNIEYCGAPSINSNACTLCIFKELRQKHQIEFRKLFSENKVEIIAPSTFALSFWNAKNYGLKATNRIKPNAYLQWEDKAEKTNPSSFIKIAHVGYPIKHKGWETYMKLSARFTDDPRYKFYLFSSSQVNNQDIEQVVVTVTRNDRMQMVKAIETNKIDVVVLWSLCPETFSFTLYEALAAGCFVITNPISGNIYEYIKSDPTKGIILENEEELLRLFSKGELISLVNKYQENGKPLGNILFSEEEG